MIFAKAVCSGSGPHGLSALHLPEFQRALGRFAAEAGADSTDDLLTELLWIAPGDDRRVATRRGAAGEFGSEGGTETDHAMRMKGGGIGVLAETMQTQIDAQMNRKLVFLRELFITV